MNGRTSTQTPAEGVRNALSRDEVSVLMNHLLLPLMMTLFFLQSVREFVGQIYFQNLGAMTLGASVALVVLFLSPAVVIPLRGFGVEVLRMLSVTGVIVFRFIMPFVQTTAELYMMIAGLTVLFYGMYLPVATAFLYRAEPSPMPSMPNLLISGFSLAIAADLMLRTLGITWDLSTGPLGIVITPLLCVLAGSFAYLSHLYPSSMSEMRAASSISKSKVFLAGLGFGGALFSFLTFLAYPNVIARWTAGSYEIAGLSILLGLITYTLVTVNASLYQRLNRRPTVVLLNLLALVAALDLAYMHSPLGGVLAGITSLVFVLDLRLLWDFLGSHNATLTEHAVFHFAGMLILLLFTLLYVLTLVAGQILPPLEGISPYLILSSFALPAILTVGLALEKGEVVE